MNTENKLPEPLKTFEVINTDTSEVIDVYKERASYADQANADYRLLNSPLRVIEQRPQPRPDCRCGAEILQECVCEFDNYEPEQNL